MRKVEFAKTALVGAGASTKVTLFTNDEFGAVRTTVINGEPWFVGKDVASALGYENQNRDIARHVDEDDRVMIDGKSQYQNGIELGQRGGWVINESGVYALVFGSKLPKAKEFKRWVTREVLPSIRKHGAYVTPPKIDELVANPDLLIELATTLKKEQEQRKELQAQLDVSKEWFSIKRVALHNGITFRDISWRKLKAASSSVGREVKKIFDANYGEVNAYHEDAWEIAYPELEL